MEEVGAAFVYLCVRAGELDVEEIALGVELID